MAVGGITATTGISLAPERLSSTVENQNQRTQEQQRRVETAAASTLQSAQEAQTLNAVRAVPPIVSTPVVDSGKQNIAEAVEASNEESDNQEASIARLLVFHQQDQHTDTVSQRNRAREAFNAALKLQENSAESESRQTQDETSRAISDRTANDNKAKSDVEAERAKSVNISA